MHIVEKNVLTSSDLTTGIYYTQYQLVSCWSFLQTFQFKMMIVNTNMLQTTDMKSTNTNTDDSSVLVQSENSKTQRSAVLREPVLILNAMETTISRNID